MTIDWLKDKETGIKFYPVTHEDAVIDSNGVSLSTKLNLKENTSNKVTSISSSSTNTQYPSALAVYNALQAIDTGSDSGTCPDLSLGTTSGTGNAVTSLSVNGHTITLAKETSFVDLTSAQTITGVKTFTNGLKLNAGTSWTSSDRTIPFSASGNSTTILYVNDNANTGLTFNPNTGALKAASFIKRGGTSSQFLKADGSVDSNTYLTSETPLSKGTTTGSGNAVTDITVSGHTITLNKGASFATLDSNGLVSANQLPSYVDDIIDGYKYGSDFYRPLVDGELKPDATSSDFTNDTKVTPVKNKIYFWVGDGHCYRWSGTEYVLIVASPGTTSNVPEGSNLYFTDARAQAAVATLLSGKADKVVPSAANNVALLNASGNLVDSGKTLGKSVPSNAVFTDVACNEQYHYTPSTADNSSNISLVPGGVLKIITAINLDSRKHVVSVTSGDLTKNMVGLSSVTNDKQVKGLSSGTTSGHIVTFGSDGYTIADSGKSTSDFATSTHVHGNITNAGALQTTDITIASGDKLVVTDSSNSNKVARASAAFDGSTTSSVLTKKGTFESLKTINGNSIIGTGDITITGGSDTGEDLGPLFITSHITDTSVGSGTYASITLAISDGRDVILKVINNNADDEIRYYRLLIDYSENDDLYNFSCVIGTYFYLGTISSSNSLSFTSTSLGGGSGSGLPSVTSSDNGKILLVVNGAWALVTPSTLYSGSGTPSNSLGNNGDIYILTS